MSDELHVVLDDDSLAPSRTVVGRLFREHSLSQEVISFAYDAAYLASSSRIEVDPELPLHAGRFHAPPDRLFGVFRDSVPDRWGRILMERREGIEANRDGRRPRRLSEWDFLTGRRRLDPSWRRTPASHRRSFALRRRRPAVLETSRAPGPGEQARSRRARRHARSRPVAVAADRAREQPGWRATEGDVRCRRRLAVDREVSVDRGPLRPGGVGVPRFGSRPACWHPHAAVTSALPRIAASNLRRQALRSRSRVASHVRVRNDPARSYRSATATTTCATTVFSVGHAGGHLRRPSTSIRILTRPNTLWRSTNPTRHRRWPVFGPLVTSTGRRARNRSRGARCCPVVGDRRKRSPDQAARAVAARRGHRSRSPVKPSSGAGPSAGILVAGLALGVVSG